MGQGEKRVRALVECIEIEWQHSLFLVMESDNGLSLVAAPWMHFIVFNHIPKQHLKMSHFPIILSWTSYLI